MTTTTDEPTAVQPDIHINNITDHPGSTWAGVGVALIGTAAAFIASNGVPTTKGALVTLVGALVTGALAALGK